VPSGPIAGAGFIDRINAGGKFPFQRTGWIYRVEVSVIAGANVDGFISADRR
jgi:hypothetical protein